MPMKQEFLPLMSAEKIYQTDIKKSGNCKKFPDFFMRNILFQFFGDFVPALQQAIGCMDGISVASGSGFITASAVVPDIGDVTAAV